MCFSTAGPRTEGADRSSVMFFVAFRLYLILLVGRHCEVPAWLGRAMPGGRDGGGGREERESLRNFFFLTHLRSFCLLRGACPRLVCFRGHRALAFVSRRGEWVGFFPCPFFFSSRVVRRVSRFGFGHEWGGKKGDGEECSLFGSVLNRYFFFPPARDWGRVELLHSIASAR